MLLETGILFLFSICFIFWRKRPQGFPPGPFSLPFVGNLLQVGREPHKSILVMKKDYGDVIGIDLGMKRTVCINDYKLLKEAFNKSVFCGRPKIQHFTNPENGCRRGIVFNTSKHSMEQRRFAFSYLQSGFRNGVPVENLILNEANELMDTLKLLCGSPISTSVMFNLSAINSLWTTLAGKRYCIQDKNYLKLADCVEKLTISPATQGLPVFFPLLAKLAPKLSGVEQIMFIKKPLYNFAQEIIDTHQYSYQDDVERDFIDRCLQKIQTTTDPESSFYKKIGMENLRHTLVDIFGAGMETVATTLRWTIFLMAKHPEVQEKLRHEVANYKQKNGSIMLKDRPKLPYVEAVIQELLRFSSVVPFGIFHETEDTIEFHGYLIPKGTMVIANQYGIHHDPDVWGDPENFRPERFLTDDGAELSRHQPVIAFSIGKRICPGESLARDQLFIFTVKLFECFTVEFDPSEPVPAVKHVLGTTLLPPEHKIVFKSLL